VSVTQSEIDRRKAVFSEACRKAGMKLTHQRSEIFTEVAGSEEHPDAETIFERVRRRVPAISLDTVYRTLSTLEKLGVISRVYLTCDRARFDANTRPHHHFICEECGLIRDFVLPEVDNLHLPDEVQSWGPIRSIHLELRSVCRECADRNSLS
jgi:Fur family transcriptional regulator, peroxide stress response regulator